MRVQESSRGYFRGTHKGCSIEIERDRNDPDRRFYIWVQAESGCYLYDGWAPADVRTMPQAKREALYGACLKPRPAARVA